MTGEVFLNKLKHIKIGMKFNVLQVFVILFLCILITVVAKWEIEKSLMETFEDRAIEASTLGETIVNDRFTGDWTIKGGELYKGEHNFTNDTTLVDEIGKTLSGAVTIFNGDTRIATNVQVDGQRSIGTKASDTVVDQVLKKGSTYVGVADVVGEKYVTVYQPIKDTSGKVIGMWFIGEPITKINEITQSLVLKIVLALLVGGTIAILGSILLTRALVRPIKQINRQLKEIAEGEGDLTQELIVKTEDETGELAHSFNQMLGSLRKMMKQVADSSVHVAAASEELTANAEQTTEATSQIAQSIHNIAEGAEMQENGSQNSFKSIETVRSNLQKVVDQSTTVTLVAKETSLEALNGNDTLRKVIHQMNVINNATSNASQSIDELGKQSNEIGNIVAVITAISEQTNLLALNAAIEAARAGEHGKGFAVVADEVRKLAEQSKVSASQITELILQTQKGTEKAVKAIELGTKETASGMLVVEETKQGFEKILQSVDQVTERIEEVNLIAKNMYNAVNDVYSSVEDNLNIAKNSSSTTQLVASASEEQLATMEEITSSAETMSKMAEELQLLVSQFKY
ncbi:chemotaxis protein [Viridibacillus arvi]|uniref:Chemotaxis protein n=1 Tax=Viridibacillus arvi TaxID=263475 RepID=A0A0M0LKE0_9BACL|nr:chemotaxis protein [Viridibacillus arvi]